MEQKHLLSLSVPDAVQSTLLNPHYQPQEVSTIINPILQMRRRRHREVNG